MTTTAIRSPELDALRVAPFFLPYVVYLVHTLEEIQGFADWATRNFGPETTGMFAGYHIPLMLLVGF
ncbi:MAG: hypothetical protein L0G99_16270, partial [Propionibacteriales bacterium]|nr:hypothetical protein [Propionibacteriales bacterium]